VVTKSLTMQIHMDVKKRRCAMLFDASDLRRYLERQKRVDYGRSARSRLLRIAVRQSSASKRYFVRGRVLMKMGGLL